MLGSLAPIPIEVACWDHDALSADDPLGTLTTSAGPPWAARRVKRTATGGNFDLTYSLGVTLIATTRTSVAVVSRQHDGSTYKSTLRAPNVALATFTEILGIHEPGHDDRVGPAAGTTRGSGYLAGYTSEDDRGRVFRNRKPDGSWQKDTQLVEITAVVEPPTVQLPAGAKMVWSFEDPDDPSNEPANVHDDAGRLIDPNDYGGAAKTGAAAGDNDPGGKKKAGPRFEQVDARYALSGSETAIDVPTRTTKVRFHVSDIAGDNFKVKAQVKADPKIDLAVPGETGVFTVWDRIDLEYVEMDSAHELPVGDIARHYDMACAQVDVSIKRVATGASDLPQMGTTEGAAYSMCDDYASKAAGELTKEGEGGWFFIAAANRMLPARSASILYEGDAEARGNIVRLPAGTTLAATPKVVRVFDPARAAGMPSPRPADRDMHIKFSVASRSGRNLTLNRHDFHLPEDPDNAFLDADLSHYGLATGTTIPIQVLSAGDEALVTGGISPGGVSSGGKHYFGGKLLVFTRSLDASQFIGVLCHELCHAFDNAHKCGNWDWVKRAPRQSCCMNYWLQFVLDDATPRAPLPWTQNRTGADLCGPHVRRMRDYHLQDNPGLGWP